MSPAAASDDSAAQAATRLRLVIGRLSRQLRRSQACGLTPPQLSALSSVDRYGPLRLGELAAREHLSPPALTPAVVALANLGLVDRGADPEDRRSVVVAVTARGRQLLDQVRGENTVSLARRISRLDDKDRRMLLKALGVLEQLVEDDAAADVGPAQEGAERAQITAGRQARRDRGR